MSSLIAVRSALSFDEFLRSSVNLLRLRLNYQLCTISFNPQLSQTDGTPQTKCSPSVRVTCMQLQSLIYLAIYTYCMPVQIHIPSSRIIRRDYAFQRSRNLYKSQSALRFLDSFLILIKFTHPASNPSKSQCRLAKLPESLINCTGPIRFSLPFKFYQKYVMPKPKAARPAVDAREVKIKCLEGQQSIR